MEPGSAAGYDQVDMGELVKSVQSVGFGAVYYGSESRPAAMALIPLVHERSLEPASSPSSGGYQLGAYTEMRPRQYLGCPVSVRRLLERPPDGGHADLLISELEAARRLRHPGLLLMMAVCPSDNLDSVQLVYERVPLGSLYHYLYRRTGTLLPLDARRAADLLLQVCQALMFLHAAGWLHCAITSHAVQLMSPGRVRLAMLEYAVQTRLEVGRPHRRLLANKVQGALYNWLAPEVLRDGVPSGRSDLYSFCALIWELVHGRLPWGGLTPAEVRAKVTGDEQPLEIHPDMCPTPLSHLLTLGLNLRPDQRDLQLDEVRYILTVVRDDTRHRSREPPSTTQKPQKPASVTKPSRSASDRAVLPVRRRPSVERDPYTGLRRTGAGRRRSATWQEPSSSSSAACQPETAIKPASHRLTRHGSSCSLSQRSAPATPLPGYPRARRGHLEETFFSACSHQVQSSTSPEPASRRQTSGEQSSGRQTSISTEPTRNIVGQGIGQQGNGAGQSSGQKTGIIADQTSNRRQASISAELSDGRKVRKDNEQTPGGLRSTASEPADRHLLSRSLDTAVRREPSWLLGPASSGAPAARGGLTASLEPTGSRQHSRSLDGQTREPAVEGEAGLTRQPVSSSAAGSVLAPGPNVSPPPEPGPSASVLARVRPSHLPLPGSPPAAVDQLGADTGDKLAETTESRMSSYSRRNFASKLAFFSGGQPGPEPAVQPAAAGNTSDTGPPRLSQLTRLNPALQLHPSPGLPRPFHPSPILPPAGPYPSFKRLLRTGTETASHSHAEAGLSSVERTSSSSHSGLFRPESVQPAVTSTPRRGPAPQQVHTTSQDNGKLNVTFNANVVEFSAPSSDGEPEACFVAVTGYNRDVPVVTAQPRSAADRHRSLSAPGRPPPAPEPPGSTGPAPEEQYYDDDLSSPDVQPHLQLLGSPEPDRDLPDPDLDLLQPELGLSPCLDDGSRDSPLSVELPSSDPESDQDFQPSGVRGSPCITSSETTRTDGSRVRLFEVSCGRGHQTEVRTEARQDGLCTVTCTNTDLSNGNTETYRETVHADQVQTQIVVADI